MLHSSFRRSAPFLFAFLLTTLSARRRLHCVPAQLLTTENFNELRETLPCRILAHFDLDHRVLAFVRSCDGLSVAVLRVAIVLRTCLNAHAVLSQRYGLVALHDCRFVDRSFRRDEAEEVGASVRLKAGASFVVALVDLLSHRRRQKPVVVLSASLGCLVAPGLELVLVGRELLHSVLRL